MTERWILYAHTSEIYHYGGHGKKSRADEVEKLLLCHFSIEIKKENLWKKIYQKLHHHQQ